jgi:hypothetical protein
MSYRLREIERNAWLVEIEGFTDRPISRRPEKFCTLDICAVSGRRLSAAPSLLSAVRWLRVRSGLRIEAALFSMPRQHQKTVGSASSEPGRRAGHRPAGARVRFFLLLPRALCAHWVPGSARHLGLLVHRNNRDASFAAAAGRDGTDPSCQPGCATHVAHGHLSPSARRLGRSKCGKLLGALLALGG